MSLISFDPNGNAEYRKQVEQFKKLESQDATRFRYPTSPNNSDMLKTLMSVDWNGIQFPVSRMSVDINYDIVQHKYPNRDGARLENMGRNPLIIKATAIFVNTINPGPGENWKKGTLYPNVYNQMLTESLKTETGTLNHPYMGYITAKLVSFEPDLDAHFRGGEIVNITWIETISDDNLIYVFTNQETMEVAAKSIDSAFANLNPNPADLELPPYKKGLNDLLTDVNSFINRIDMGFKHAFDSLNEIKYRCKMIVDSCNRLNQSRLSFVKEWATTLHSGCVIMQHQSPSSIPQTQSTQEEIKTVVTLTDASLSTYVILTRNTIDELSYLNPLLLRYPIIPQGSLLRYYVKPGATPSHSVAVAVYPTT